MRIGGLGVIAALASAFFTVHYGMFTVGHGVFVASLFGQPSLADAERAIRTARRYAGLPVRRPRRWLAAIGIALLQIAAFVRWSNATRSVP